MNNSIENRISMLLILITFKTCSTHIQLKPALGAVQRCNLTGKKMTTPTVNVYIQLPSNYSCHSIKHIHWQITSTAHDQMICSLSTHQSTLSVLLPRNVNALVQR